jgi:hypothetical protein
MVCGLPACYAGDMNTSLPVPVTGRILLAVTPAAGIEPLLELTAHLAERGTLYVLDGGNTFQGYRLASILRRRSPEYAALLAKVMLARVFTCYQMSALLEEGEFGPVPLLLFDLLATFYDQSVRVADRRRLLNACLARLKRLSTRAPVVIWVPQRSAIPQEALGFLDVVQAAAGQTWAPALARAPEWRQTGLWNEPGQEVG